MALSETFPPQCSTTINRPGRKTAHKSTRIPVTARELVEWTYADQRAQGVLDVSAEPQGRSQSGVVFDLMTEYALLGCNVDRSAGAVTRWGETKCHEDALTVHSIIDASRVMLPRGKRGPLTRGAALLIEHGKHRSVPDWQPKIFPMRCVPVQGSGGKPRGLYLGSGRLHVGSEIAYEGDWPSRDALDDYRVGADAHNRLWADPENWPGIYKRRSARTMVVEHDWSPEPYRRCADEVLQRARDEYREWYEALWALCDGLEAAGTRGLRRYRITALGAAYEPWEA